MKEMDCVEVLVEKERYAKCGVHKGMQGWICDPRSINDARLVSFPRYGDNGEIATIAIKEADLKLLPDGLDATANQRIEAEFIIY